MAVVKTGVGGRTNGNRSTKSMATNTRIGCLENRNTTKAFPDWMHLSLLG